MSTISLVVPTELVDNKHIGPAFVAEAYRKNNKLPMGQPYGTFIWDGQWHVLIIKSDMIVFGERGQADAIGLPKLPDCIVLVAPNNAETVERLLKGAGHMVTNFPHQGTLKTHGK